MGKVHKLDRLTSNKIAAGEVVEKPASVVKELIENSIDAGAKNITLEIKNGGKTLIKITDDGHGIEEDDLLIAFERHATSKINNVEDIYNIRSLGFRGEALASISAVSNIELITKTKNDTSGNKLILSGSKLIEQKPFGCNVGTQIAVKDLFFNTPARLKFLKSNVAEQSAITDIINKLAISNPSIGFKYLVDNKNMFLTKDDNNLKNTIFSIYGRNVASNLIEVDDETDGIKINGFVSNLQLTRGNRQLQNLFVNNRYIKNDDISDSIKSAYKTMLPINRHPIVFLFLEIDPSLVDVNVHPAKTEVKFGNSGFIKQAVYAAVRKALISHDLVPKSTLSTSSYSNFIKDEKEDRDKNNASSQLKEHLESKKNTVRDEKPFIIPNEIQASNEIEASKEIDKPNHSDISKLEKEVSSSTGVNIEEDQAYTKDINPRNKEIPKSLKENIIKDEFLKKMGQDRSRPAINRDQISDFKSNKGLGSNKDLFIKESKSNDGSIPYEAYEKDKRIDFDSKPAVNNSFNKQSVASSYKNEHMDFKKEISILDDIFIKESPQIEITDVSQALPLEASIYDDLFYIGVIFKTYLLFERNSDMYMIDQHAAHEKILYEEYLELYKEKKIPSQILLEPLIIDLSYSDVIKVENNMELFESMGIRIDVFGKDSIIVRELPIIFNLPLTKNFILEIIEKIDEKEIESLYTLKVDRIIQASCKNAIKANDNLMDIEVDALLKRLKGLNDPYTCPHGRPIIISISKGEIMKKFKRT